MQMNFESAFLAISIIVVLLLCAFGFGCSVGESEANKKILERQHQEENAKRWQEVLQKMNERGLV
jgi:uncharacterized protein YacL